MQTAKEWEWSISNLNSKISHFPHGFYYNLKGFLHQFNTQTLSSHVIISQLVLCYPKQSFTWIQHEFWQHSRNSEPAHKPRPVTNPATPPTARWSRRSAKQEGLSSYARIMISLSKSALYFGNRKKKKSKHPHVQKNPQKIKKPFNRSVSMNLPL